MKNSFLFLILVGWLGWDRLWLTMSVTVKAIKVSAVLAMPGLAARPMRVLGGQLMQASVALVTPVLGGGNIVVLVAQSIRELAALSMTASEVLRMMELAVLLMMGLAALVMLAWAALVIQVLVEVAIARLFVNDLQI